MIDIKLIRTNPDLVKANIKKREMNLDSVVDEILEIDAKRRELTGSTEAMKAEQNACTKKITAMKKAGEDVAPVMAEMKALSDKIKAADAELGEIEAKQQELMLGLPNMPDEDVAAGGKEQNVPVHYFGEQPKFDFEPKNHVDLCESLGMIDYPRGAKVGGNGAWIYRGAGARLEWALLNFFINEHLADGYELILPPHMLNYECGYVAGQFPKFSEEVYWIQNPTSADKKYMLPTAETVLVNLHRDEILTGIAAADDDGLARPEHRAKKRILQQAFLHYKGHILPRLDHGRQHKCLQRAHMVADEDARAFQGTEMLQPGGFNAAAHGFERVHDALAALSPCLAVVLVAHGVIASLEHNPEHGRVEPQVRVDAAQEGRGTRGRQIAVGVEEMRRCRHGEA